MLACAQLLRVATAVVDIAACVWMVLLLRVSRAPAEKANEPAPAVLSSSALTYCPGPECALEEKARAYCASLPGLFQAEPDFTCTLADGVHRLVCDDVPDEHQCGHMSHSDLEYARLELRLYWRSHPMQDVDVAADERAGLYRCREGRRSVSCTFSDRRARKPHPKSPIVCEHDGCRLFGDPPDR